MHQLKVRHEHWLMPYKQPPTLFLAVETWLYALITNFQIFTDLSMTFQTPHSVALQRKHYNIDSQWCMYQEWNMQYLTPYPDTLLAVIVPIIQSVMQMRKHLPLPLPLPTTSKQSHGTEPKLPLRVRNPCFSFSTPFRMAFLHLSRIFPKIFRNNTNIEMTCTLLMVSFFPKIALWYRYP